MDDVPNFEGFIFDFGQILFDDFGESLFATFDLSVGLNVFEDVAEYVEELLFFDEAAV